MRRNQQPAERKPDEMIDAATAVIMAMGRAMVEGEQAKGRDGFSLNPILW
jgi:hypothetical protein